MEKTEIQKIVLGLRDSGLSFGKIAAKLNSDSVPTISGKGKWEQKMVQRICGKDALKTAEKRVGVVTDNQAEIESLESELNTVKQSVAEKQTEIDRLTVENERLESDKTDIELELNNVRSEFAALRAELDIKIKEMELIKIQDTENQAEFQKALKNAIQENEALQVSVKQITEKLVNIDQLRAENETLRTQKDVFKAESEKLQRSLNGAESNYRQQHQDVLNKLGSELAAANQTIQELRDKQEFIKLNTVKHYPDLPQNFNGWTVNPRSDGKGINLVKKFSGKLKGLYVGKEWNEDVAQQKINAFLERHQLSDPLFAS
jgi:DNA repair exonuclease SbcCD ATPase subunit